MRKTTIFLSVLLSAATATAQQTGAIEGVVTLHGGAMPEAVAVVAQAMSCPAPGGPKRCCGSLRVSRS